MFVSVCVYLSVRLSVRLFIHNNLSLIYSVLCFKCCALLGFIQPGGGLGMGRGD